MRSLILVLILACLFGAAAVWQQTRTTRLREERALALELASGQAALTQSGLLGPGQANVVIGRPSGAAPLAPGAQQSPGGSAGPVAKPPAPGPAPKPGTAPPPALGDFELTVNPGQSLSKIAQAHYGHSPADLVSKLAAYNGLKDANAMRAGMKLKLPTLERLGVVLKAQ
ncbi:MAG: LysM peptidoglycan-binding domain-containing protein [Planctomycetes bacterium]|jgi:nucleoid-associated protein YgaU|nr:LysM peptidoglycan-binding domain-containing protein [Planctomycetota bacterium]